MVVLSAAERPASDEAMQVVVPSASFEDMTVVIGSASCEIVGDSKTKILSSCVVGEPTRASMETVRDGLRDAARNGVRDGSRDGLRAGSEDVTGNSLKGCLESQS